MNFQYFKMVTGPSFIDKREVGEPSPSPPPKISQWPKQFEAPSGFSDPLLTSTRQYLAWREKWANLNLEKEKYSNRA